jgi:glycosyl transferase family 87
MSGGLVTGATLAARPRAFVATALPILAVLGVVICIVDGLRTLAATLPDVIAAFPQAPFALDGSRQLAVATVVLAGGDPYSVPGNLYPPPGAFLLTPLTPLGPEAGVWASFAIKVAIVVVCVVDATGGRRPAVRLLALAFTATSLAILDDLWLGNVSILLAAAIYLAVSRDRPWAAVPLGIGLALLAKPFIVPVVLWFLVYRRRSAVAMLGTAVIVTLLAALAMGPGVYRDYFEALRAATGIDLSYGQGLAAIAPALLIPSSVLLGALYVLLLWRSRDEASLLMWALLLGLVAAPYVVPYSIAPVFAAIPAFARAHPSRTLVLAAAVAPLALISIMAATAVALVVAFPVDVLKPLRARMRTGTSVASATD